MKRARSTNLELLATAMVTDVKMVADRSQFWHLHSWGHSLRPSSSVFLRHSVSSPPGRALAPSREY